MISIIVPVYNVEQYLHQCIGSILLQSYTDFELLLIDDGSTDQSGQICDEYAARDRRVKVFHKKNGGVSRARNTGLDHARGEYILFVDSDDWLEPACLSILKDEVKDSDLLFFGAIHELPDGRQERHCPTASISEGRQQKEETILYLKINAERYEYFGYTWNKLFRRSIIEAYEIQFVEGLSLREDEVFTANYCWYVRRLRVIDNALYHYRITTGGLTFRRKTADVYIHYANYLHSSLLYYALPALLSYEENRLTMTLALAFASSDSIRQQWQIARHIAVVRKDASVQQWPLKPRLIAHRNTLATFIMAWMYKMVFKMKHVR